jgi:hypothetical protein
MAISLLGGSGYTHGIETSESSSGVNAAVFEARYFPEIDARLAGITGETFLRGRSAKVSREITLSGEVSGSMSAFTFSAAVSFANDVATFGDGSGTILMDEVTESQSRDGWRSVSIRASSNPLCVVT